MYFHVIHGQAIDATCFAADFLCECKYSLVPNKKRGVNKKGGSMILGKSTKQGGHNKKGGSTIFFG